MPDQILTVFEHTPRNPQETSMTTLFRRIAYLLLLLGAAAAGAQTPTVRIHEYDGIVSTLPRVAIEKGFCAKHGVNCVLQKINSGALAIQGVLAGSIEIAQPAPEIAVAAAVRGSDLKQIAGAWSTNSLMLIVGPAMIDAAKRGYPSIVNDLKGKKIGVNARGTAGEFLMTTMLQDVGLKPSDVTYVAVGGGNTAYQALATQQVDAIMAFPPVDSFCRVLKTCAVAVAFADGQGPREITATNGNGGAYFVKREFAAKQPKAVEGFVNAMNDAERFVKDPANNEEMVRITLKYFRLEIAEGEAIVRDALNHWRSSMTLTNSRAGLQATADYMFKTGQLQSRFDVSKLD
jgi:NitT/TauT family transport system substrate-binding protein